MINSLTQTGYIPVELSMHVKHIALISAQKQHENQRTAVGTFSLIKPV
jgi:hypothetical protein